MGNKKSTLRMQRKSKPESNGSAVSSVSHSQSQSWVMRGREYHNVENSTYVLPKDDFEKDCLHQQHFIVKEQLGGQRLRLLQYKRNLLKKDLTAPLFENGVHALDVGCGPGSWVLDMATDYPNSEIEGIDMADTFPTAIHPPNARFSNANLLEPLQFDRKFDFVQMRFFALALRKEEWAITYRHIHDVLKDGGYFQHVETTAMPDTADPVINRIFGALASLQRNKGQDPTMCPKLSTLAEDSGFEVIHQQKYVIEAGWGSRADQLMSETIGTAVVGLAPFLAVEMKISEDECRKLAEQAIANFAPSKTVFYLDCFLAKKRSGQ
ncbi:unnamed protein product [Umbelopsis vinacea]